MKVDGNKLKFEKTLWVQFEGVDTSEEGTLVVVQPRSDDAYVKVFNQFGRLLKLYTFANGQWIDSETGMAPTGFDESQAGRLTTQPTAAPAVRSKAPARAKQKAASAARSGASKSTAKKKAKKAGTKSAAKSKSGGVRMVAKKKAVKKKTAGKARKAKKPAKKKSRK